MKTNLLRTSIVAVLAVAAAFAQNSMPVKATVPFDFMVGNQLLPAGQYNVDRGPATSTVMVRSDDGKKAAIVFAQAVSSAATQNTCSLVFHRYGDTYFLSEIWSPGNSGRKLFPTSRERELAARRKAPANATIAAER